MFACSVVFILGLYRDGVDRGIAFVIKNSGGFKGAIGFEGEEGVVVFSVNKMVGNRPTLWVGGIELADDGADGLVFGDGKSGGGIELGGSFINIPQGKTEANVVGAVTRGIKDTASQRHESNTVVPRTTPANSECSRRRTIRVSHSSTAIFRIPI